MPDVLHTADVRRIPNVAGATAFDAVNKDVTDRLIRIGVAEVDITKPTFKRKPFTVTYQVDDAAGNKATAKRIINVVCPTNEAVCCGSSKLQSADTDCSDPDGLSCTSGVLHDDSALSGRSL